MVAAIAGAFLLRGSPETKQSRLLAAAGTVLPLIIALSLGSDSKAFSITLPLGLILTALGGLLFSNIEDPKQETTPFYAAVITAIVAFSIAGWALYAAQR